MDSITSRCRRSAWSRAACTNSFCAAASRAAGAAEPTKQSAGVADVVEDGTSSRRDRTPAAGQQQRRDQEHGASPIGTRTGEASLLVYLHRTQSQNWRFRLVSRFCPVESSGTHRPVAGSLPGVRQVLEREVGSAGDGPEVTGSRSTLSSNTGTEGGPFDRSGTSSAPGSVAQPGPFPTGPGSGLSRSSKAESR